MWVETFFIVIYLCSYISEKIYVVDKTLNKIYMKKEQMDSVCREREVLRKNQKDMLEIKNTVTETNNAFDSVISRLDMAEERI